MTLDRHSKLFLSCDLVGSTNYKQRQAVAIPADGVPWQATFLGFYHDFPQVVADVSKTWMASHASDHHPKFELWKPIGDELVFMVDVRHEHAVYNAVRIWLAALNEWDERMKPLGMGTKGGAFIATFPGPDRAVAVPRTLKGLTSDADRVNANDKTCQGPADHSEYLYDFFGPSIDTGFRLFNQATPRRFPVSVEVVFAMQHATYQKKKGHGAVLDDLEYHGGRELKGVWNQRDYPFFTIDRRHTDPVNAAVKVLRTESDVADLGALRRLCQACIEDPAWPSAIYLPESGDDALKQKREDPLKAYKTSNEQFGSEKQPNQLNDGRSLPEDASLGD